jgi:DNA helicase II / ATP-dependent DNA helicase PcrA
MMIQDNEQRFDIEPQALQETARQKAPDYLHGLNAEQYSVATELRGATLALAGAGTGKTRALTARIAHILHTESAKPWEILAVTFTNRAAREMSERVIHLTGIAEGLPWLGTFHSICVKLLRRHSEAVGLPNNFIIINEDDAEKLAKQILEEAGVDLKKDPPKLLLYYIDGRKNKGLTPRDVLSTDVPESFGGKALLYYAEYQERLRRAGAVDFGDLILYCIQLFRENPDILQLYHQRFRHILADEYQDTNTAQYLWLRLLAQGGADLCCVGDDDQSIYGWRGAEVGNILRFEKDFKGAKIIRLERNYRSTPEILRAASGLISHNRDRLGKTLFTADENSQERVKILGLLDGDDEARQIVDMIEDYKRDGSRFEDIAILTRTSAQMRVIEDRLTVCSVPYRIYGGMKFYERAEIRDLLAYLRLIVQPHDDLAFERAIGKPKRGIGDAALAKMRLFGREENCSVFTAAGRLLQQGEFKNKQKTALENFLTAILRWSGLQETVSVGEIVRTVTEESGYAQMLRDDKNKDSTARLDNVRELARSAEGFENLYGFLEHIALLSEATKEAGERGIVMMTLHAAKGLEFETVFLPGWEEGLFPSQRTIDENGQAGVEEERRLAYVGVTRARKRAIISFASGRRMYNRWQNAAPSRFIAEIPDDATEKIGAGFSGIAKSAGGSRFANAYDSRENRFDAEYFTPGWQRAKAEYAKPVLPAPEKKSFEYSEPQNITDWKLGDTVIHPRFGIGTVKRAEEGDTLTVIFHTEGEKRLFSRFVRRLPPVTG